MGADSVLLLAVAGVASGLTGSIAGLASLFSYPALLAAGLIVAQAAHAQVTLNFVNADIYQVAKAKAE